GKSYIRHGDVMAGGELAFVMGERPDKAWGVGDADVPVSAIIDFSILPVPCVTAGSRIFSGSTEVALASIVDGARIHYTLNGDEPGAGSNLYEKPFTLTQSTTVRAVATAEGFPPSGVVTAEFHRIPYNRGIRLDTSCSGMYSAGGDMALIDGLRGTLDFRTGLWQGYEGVDLDAVVDLGRVRRINRIATGFLQDQNSWIFFPEMVEYSISNDGKRFASAAKVAPGAPAPEEGPRIDSFASGKIGASARYVRVHAKNIGLCPPWHAGAGGKAWIFADEIVIE
ncbi:MAG: chitobiase/beta-hexosaminidase C-terminal domain-containing protein, partial [Candidatus Krumholzibacteria bacterium]|nr:chitobiase/beta-hexosaminidase C-terminal domain-containing protein [Candidatus Krumholzibacteria bacterium]